MLVWSLLVAAVAAFEVPPRDYQARDYFMLETTASNVRGLAANHPLWRYEHPARAIDKYQVFSVPKGSESVHQLAKRDDLGSDVLSVHPLPAKKLVRHADVPIDTSPVADPFVLKRSKPVDSSEIPVAEAEKEFGIDDPEFPKQWHIINTQFPGHDVNVVPVWRQNITGYGVVTAILDDGVDYDSPDLKDNFCPEGSWDYNDKKALPKPILGSDYHGTRCAGEIAAKKGNGFCGVGVAYGSRVSGVRILSGELTSEDEAAAMVQSLDVNDIFSCSWGPPDNGQSMDKPDKIVREAILKGVQEGRQGKGALYVFASGNGAMHGDSCNFDGYTNSIYSITVSAIDHRGLHPPYAEACAAVMVSTYSSGAGEYIHTTDYHEGCSAHHGGTSAAAPLAAGLYSLVLEANPDLTWRDIQHLTVLSAVEVDSSNNEWQASAIPGRRYSYSYGWGKLDVNKTVAMAKDNYQLLKPQAWYYTPYQTVENGLVTRDNSGNHVYEATFEISPEVLKRANLDHIEQLVTTVKIDSTKRGAVSVHLISPNGIDSRLAQARSHDMDAGGFQDWSFSSVAHWAEKPAGTWKLRITNNEPKDHTVTLKGWQLKLFGESIDASKAKRFDIDEDYSKINDEADNEDNKDVATNTEAAPDSTKTEATDAASTAATTTTAASTSAASASAAKSQSTSVASTASFKTASATATETPAPSDDDASNHKKSSIRFGFNHYALILLAAGFFVCLWLLKNRRKPGRSRQRDEYEFDIINPEEEDSDFDRNSRFQSDEESRIENSMDRDRHGAADEFDDDAVESELRRDHEERELLFQTGTQDSPVTFDDDENDPFSISDTEDMDNTKDAKGTKDTKDASSA